ncbi:uncharacterized protein C2845_PM08G23090 [Panicum miliaceum]|uniref:Transcription factor IIIC 90kDa subunit N-terminal domain-containing protein n=1 Tax=Panicum miliaceum TaxID=4540 RepID=A0A3L6QZC0_PANMI|nr:uncharacterized protein C2845_PM08G23090 [Panicum miliaceum]
MAPQYQAVTPIASPSYPNAIAWSSDNLVAVASGHIVTILNPAALDGPRGLVGLRCSDPFPIGVVNREDLFEPCLVPTCLARDAEPCTRSISWSPQGFAPNSGCLLAVCTVDGHVKLYRSPIWEVCDEWVQVADISQLLFSYYKTINFGEDNGSHLTSLKNTNTEETEVLGSTCELQDPLFRRGPGQRKRKPPRVDGYIYDGNKDDLDASNDADFSLKSCSKSKKKSSKKTAKHRHEPVSVNGQGSTENAKASLSSNGENKSLPLITAKHVKIWLANIKGLNRCTIAEEVPFALVAEVTTDLSAPVSSISLAVPAWSQYEVNLAIGRVSGSLETWIWNTCSCKIENTNACHAHDQVVTGLSWGMDGYCLYSCSQDNSARCWIYHGNNIEEIPVHTNFPESKESTDLSEVSNRCFGLTLAPGGQMIAVVRGLDLNLLDQMYQARTQKAVVEFIWIGGQFVGIPLDRSIDVCNPQSTIFSSSNFLWWGSNILWSLKKYENVEKGLALWDVVAALQGFKKYAPTFLETLMDMWISALVSGDPQCVSINAPSFSRHDMLPSVSLRKLHLLNIICRKVMLSNHAQLGPDAENGNDSTTEFWNTLLIRSERELRERLVGFTFAAVLKRTAYSFNDTSTENSWFPVGVAQMDSWVTMNDEVHDQLKYLRSRIKDLGNRINSACGYSVEETCPNCSAPAICRNWHTLTRCRASMILCSVLQPVWHCVCCGGMVDKLLPQSFFAMQASPLDANQEEGSLDLSGPAVPLCPFCGILLQRSTPVFLLSTSPV